MRAVQAHWGLSADPFPPRNAPFVATSVHAEAVARLLHAVDSGDRRISLRAAEGLGKTSVLDRVAEELRGPCVRVVRAVGIHDLECAILGALSVRLPAREPVLSRLASAVRTLRLQKIALVVLVDDADEGGRGLLSRLSHLDLHPESRISVIDAGPSDGAGAAEAWSLAVRLIPLTRSETGHYLAAKLALAGRREPTFTDRAITAIHSLAAGVPKGLDRIASLAMIAATANRLEIITPEVIHGVFPQCVGPRAA